MKIFKNLFGNNSKISADEIAVTKDLMVSGAVIVDSGSNANGNYVKWADGTMVCYCILTNSIGSYSTSWNFPVTFVGNPVMNTNVNINNGGDANVYAPTINIFSLSSSSCRVHCFDGKLGTSFPDGYRLMLLAIGRWK